MKKTYEAPNTVVSNVSLIHNGKVFVIDFNPISAFAGSHTGKGSMLITKDKELQEAIESSRYFDKTIFLFKVEEDVEEVAKEEERDYKVVPIDSPADARDYLQENYGIDKKRILNIKQIKTAAQKVGIVFDGI